MPKRCSVLFFLVACSLSLSVVSFAAEVTSKFETSARGLMSYRKFQTFDSVDSTVPYWRSQADLNEVELKGEYALSPQSSVEMELEFEHGGSGMAMEYDNLEEFGEFESEIEQGGEVRISELYYEHKFDHQLRLKAGKIPVSMSLGSIQENYFLYPSVLSSSAEIYMLPEDWRELGAELQKSFGPLHVRLAVINGLNSEFFRSYNWIGGGYQRRFEGANASALAEHALIGYGNLAHGNGVAAAVYYGDTSSNRYKQSKLTIDAHLLLYSLMASWRYRGIGLRGEWIEGYLQNSDKVTEANASLGHLAAPGSFSPLGHKAGLQMIELSYRFLQTDEDDLTAFTSYQHINTMESVQGSVSPNDRYNQLFITGGLAFRFDRVMFLKAQYTKMSNARTGIPATDEYELAFGFDLKGPRF